MGAGGIIHQAKVLLTAAEHKSMYDQMTPATKLKVDAIKAKKPHEWTKEDCLTLLAALTEAVNY